MTTTIPQSTCTVDDCPKPAKKKGWCDKHYMRWYQHGDPLFSKYRKPDAHEIPVKLCSIPGCGEEEHAKGWCHNHYRRFLRNGDPLAPDQRGRWLRNGDPPVGPQDRGFGPCTIDDCVEPMLVPSKGWCRTHYLRWYRHGDPLIVFRRRFESDEERRAAMKAHQARYLHQARGGNGPWEQIDLPGLYERDDGLCHLCGGEVVPDGRDYLLGWSMDHLIPVSHGGLHTWENVKLAHRSCNSRKGNRHVGVSGSASTAGTSGSASTAGTSGPAGPAGPAGPGSCFLVATENPR